MTMLSLLSNISFIGALVFTALWFITSSKRVDETNEFDVVVTK